MLDSIQLRDTVENDLPVFYEQQLDEEAVRMAGFPSRERGAFMAHWRKIMADDAVTVKTILFEGQIAGHMVCFEQLGEHEVGYWLGREFWGKGIATEALTQFLQQIQTRPLYAHTAKHNIASKRVLEKCGFQVGADDQFFSKLFGKNIQEYVLMLNPTGAANHSEKDR